MTKQIKANSQYTRALIAENSFNKESRTFDVVFVTENPVRTFNYDLGYFNEILSCNPEHIRKQRAEKGLPVFDNHLNLGVTSQLGKGSNIQFTGTEGRATIKLGARADEALISDLENGILDGVSLYYRVYAYKEEGIIKEGQIKTLRAIDWEPFEISLAPVQADVNSGIRKENDEHIINIDYSQTKNDKMTIVDIRANATDEQKARLEAIIEATRAAKLADDKVVELYESEKTIESIRSEYTKPEPVNEPVDVDGIRKKATEAQLNRLDAIEKSVKAAKLPESKTIEYFRSNMSLEAIRQLIIDEFVKDDPQVRNIQGSKDAIDKKRGAMENALLHRAYPSKFKLDDGNEYRGLSLVEMVRALASEKNENLMNVDKFRIAEMVFEKRTHSTSDFPYLLEAVTDKMLRAEYAFEPEYWSLIAKQTTNQDFRAKNLYQVDSRNGMKETPEGGEIQYTTLDESKQTIRLKKYSEGIKFTREAFINDDMNAFSIIPSAFVKDWDEIRGDLVWALITDNVTMFDSVALFHATHGNLITGNGSALSDTGLTNALKAFKAQTSISGRRLRIRPKYLIVSADQEIAAKKLLAPVVPNTTAAVNVWSNAGIDIIVEGRLSGNAWYLAADPMTVDSLYYSYLGGNASLRSNREDNFDSDSIKFGVRGEFGVAAIDYRGLLKANGTTTQG